MLLTLQTGSERTCRCNKSCDEAAIWCLPWAHQAQLLDPSASGMVLCALRGDLLPNSLKTVLTITRFTVEDAPYASCVPSRTANKNPTARA